MPAIACLLSSLALGTGTLHGTDEPPADTVYETATVEARPLDVATASVEVIEGELIESAVRLSDLLTFVPGVTVTTAGTRAGLSTAQIRGGDPNFTRILLDGIPLDDATYPVGTVTALETLPLEAVERIEVVRGPTSSIDGATGLAGVIHLITRPTDREPTLRSEVAVGDAEYRRVELGAAGTGSRHHWSLGAGHEGESERVAEERFERTSLHGRLDRSGEDPGASTLRITTHLSSWSVDDYPDASGGPLFGDGELRRSDDRTGSLGASLTLPGRRRDHRFRLSLHQHAYERASPAVRPQVPASVEDNRFVRSRLGWSSSSTTRADHRWSFGAEIEHEQARVESQLDLGFALVDGTYDDHRTTSGLFADWLHDTSNMTVEAALRADVVDDDEVRWSPRLGVAWRPTGSDWRLRASVARGFGLPSFFALASPPALGGNLDLRPETVTGADLGIELDRGAWSVQTTVFYNRFEDLVDFDFETFSHVNRDEVTAFGVETGWRWRVGERLDGRLDVTWQDVESADGATLRHRPEWTAAWRTSWRPADRWRLTLESHLVDDRLDEQVPTGPGVVEASLRWALAGQVRLGQGWSLGARIDNLTDENDQAQLGFPLPERSVVVRLRWRREDG